MGKVHELHKFLDIRVDYVFKKLFEHMHIQRLLIPFFERNPKEDHTLKKLEVELELGNTEIQIVNPKGNMVWLDILARLENGKWRQD